MRQVVGHSWLVRYRPFDDVWLVWENYRHEDVAMQWQVVGVFDDKRAADMFVQGLIEDARDAA